MQDHAGVSKEDSQGVFTEYLILIIITILNRKYSYQLHLTDEDTEAQSQ